MASQWARRSCSGRIELHLEPDVVGLDGGAVVRRPGHRDLELARHERELRVQRGPLPQDLGIGPWVRHLVCRVAGEMVGRHVPGAIAGGLDGVHLDLGELLQDARHVLEKDRRGSRRRPMTASGRERRHSRAVRDKGSRSSVRMPLGVPWSPAGPRGRSSVRARRGRQPPIGSDRINAEKLLPCGSLDSEVDTPPRSACSSLNTSAPSPGAS
jgi:hypothetical protein